MNNRHEKIWRGAENNMITIQTTKFSESHDFIVNVMCSSIFVLSLSFVLGILWILIPNIFLSFQKFSLLLGFSFFFLFHFYRSVFFPLCVDILATYTWIVKTFIVWLCVNALYMGIEIWDRRNIDEIVLSLYTTTYTFAYKYKTHQRP